MDNSVYCISYYTLVSMKHSHSIVRWVGIPSRRTNQCVWPLDLHSPCFRFDPASSAKKHYQSLSTGVKMKIGYLIPHIYHINIIWINMVYTYLKLCSILIHSLHVCIYINIQMHIRLIMRVVDCWGIEYWAAGLNCCGGNKPFTCGGRGLLPSRWMNDLVTYTHGIHRMSSFFFWVWPLKKLFVRRGLTLVPFDGANVIFSFVWAVFGEMGN